MAYKKVLLEGDSAVLSDVAPFDVDFGPASAGVAATASRQDHKHDVPEALVGDLASVDGGAAAVGVANKFVRADHKHPLGTLVANMDFGGFQAINLLLEKLAANPTEAAARIYFNTVDLHPYIGQVG